MDINGDLADRGASEGVAVEGDLTLRAAGLGGIATESGRRGLGTSATGDAPEAFGAD